MATDYIIHFCLSYSSGPLVKMYAMLDVETERLAHGERPKTLFWGLATEDDEYRTFSDTAKLERFMLRESEPLRVLHHSNYDVIQLLKDGCWNIKVTRSHNTKLIMCKWGEHLMLNSYAMFPTSLDSIIQANGYPAKASLDDLEERNYQDCVWGLDSCLKMDQVFRDVIGQSPLMRHTIASTAFHALQACAGKLPKDLRFAEAYRGGKVDVYDTRFYPLCHKFDANSSYPFAFLDCPDEDNLIYAEVAHDCYYTPFFHADTRERLLFPTGTFKTWFYESNYERYIRPNIGPHTIRTISTTRIDLRWLKECAPVIIGLYNKKNSAVKGGAIQVACKFGLNSGYGRIGLKPESEKCEILDYIPDHDGVTAACIGPGKFLCWYKIMREANSNYPFAAYITDNARARLYAANKTTDSLYCDTDSVFTLGKCPSPIGSLIGEWKFEGREPFRGYNVKDYEWGSQFVVKRDGESIYGPGERHVKGGLVSLQWTMKRMVKGLGVNEVKRQYTGQLMKRVLHADGTTSPIKV